MSRIGLDPEVAIIHKKTGEGKSAHHFIKELKQYRFHYDNGGGNMLGSEAERDGAAIEVRSIVASACRDNVIPYIAEAIRQQYLDLQAWNSDYTLSSQPVFTIPKTDLTKAPKDVLEFGCRPDIDAYTLETKDPQLPKTELRRFTGGHIHYSPMGAKNNIEQQAALAILFDYFVSVPIVAILGEKFRDGEAERRAFYGQPGSFRYDDAKDKIEFRTLSGRGALLHPTLLYWSLGMMKAMVASIPRMQGGKYLKFLTEQIVKKIEPQVVFDTVLTHDVSTAETLCKEVFKLLPTYKVDNQALANPMSGGGAGTTNPYFFEKATEVFILGNKNGYQWDGDMQINWGLYEDYMPKHHAYWGIQQAMVGLCDDTIFPYNEILAEVWPKELIQEKPMWIHPLNGGAQPYVKPGAAGWLA